MSEEAHGAHGEKHYVKVWAILVVLLGISIIGPEIGIQWLTLITAFGIAVVKAYMVLRNFMHINVEPRFIHYLVATCLLFMFLFYAGASPDVMEEEGHNWVKPAWVTEEAEFQKMLETQGEGGHGGGHGEHGSPAAEHH